MKLLKNILLKVLSSNAAKQLIIELLREICKKTNNNLDDRAVDYLEQQLFPTRKISSLP